ncbi:MAG: prephenate dehydratase [Bacteroidota bacterium]
MRVAFQGVHGAYSEVAAKKFFKNQCTTLPFESFDDVFTAVERKRADRGIIPIENSLAGSIHQNYDLLLSHSLHIVGEIHLRIEHVLMCHPSSSLKNIMQVRSHPQALAQCKEFFSVHPHLKPTPYFDTAGAAKSILKENAQHIGAIASEHAAKLYGLKILKRNIESKIHNFTRFLVISRTAWKPKRTVATKSSIVVAPASNQTGILFRMLGVFYVRNIDLLKIESRPDPHSPFEYLFYIDLNGSPRKKKVAQAFEHLQEIAKLFRLLGAYPMGKGNFYGAAR